MNYEIFQAVLAYHAYQKTFSYNGTELCKRTVQIGFLSHFVSISFLVSKTNNSFHS